ncbi:MAG: hypothetical protein EON56_05250 [Alphaproteobacteria bacterium]|nr:MAG: hypothetical protein EON56_05250 [Alphaproteobacteria bacterium]
MAFAPASEVAITIQFYTPSLALNAIELADLYSQFSATFTEYDEVAPAGPMVFSVAQVEGSEPLAPQPSPFRARLRAPETYRSIMIQSDRMTYSWLRSSQLDEPDNYPGFDVLLDEFRSHWQTLSDWVQSRSGLSIEPRVGEIVYVNGFLFKNEQDEAIRLSSVYSFLDPLYPPRLTGSFQYSWIEPLLDNNGLLNVTVAGPAVAVTGIPVSVLTLSGTFLISESASVWTDLLTVRQRINETFSVVVRQESITS